MAETPDYPLDLLRAELKAALGEHMLALVDRFASKSEVSNIERLFAAHEQADVVRYDSIQGQIGRVVGFQNKLLGGLILASVLVPTLTTALVHFLS